MDIKTNSIIDMIELNLNKSIDQITQKELDNVKYLRVYRNTSIEESVVDINDLKYFENIEEISIENCMVDEGYITNLKSLKNLKKIEFIHCDFIDDIREYFNSLNLEELIINDVIGIEDYIFSNIKKLVIINSDFNFYVSFVNTLDISRCSNIKTNLYELDVNELIINANQLTDEFIYLPCKIIIKNEYDEVIKVIDHD